MADKSAAPARPPEEFPVGVYDKLYLAAEDERAETGVGKPWKVLVVDDEPEVHAVTKLALSDFSFATAPLEFLHAHSAAEAQSILMDNPDTALILLDVVMETDHAGLDFARFVRQDLRNHFVRIILRTGQPGLAPEREVMERYDINDYRAKSELTRDRLFSVVHTALGSYRDLLSLARSRYHLTGAVNELEQFAFIASRDMSAPLKELVNEVQLLQRRCAGQIDARGQEHLGNIWTTLMRMQAVVDDLLTLANIGGQGEVREPVNCEQVLGDVRDSLRDLIRKRRAQLSNGPLPTIYANRWQLTQLFENLIDNAIKFQPADPPQVRVDCVPRNNHWVFSVTDKGVGVPREEQEKIFRVFQRIASGEEHEGTGIGLAICEKIVRWHGGRIWVESEPGQGATFFFTIARRQEDPASP
jgi:signal transduction histidine kinase